MLFANDNAPLKSIDFAAPFSCRHVALHDALIGSVARKIGHDATNQDNPETWPGPVEREVERTEFAGLKTLRDEACNTTISAEDEQREHNERAADKDHGLHEIAPHHRLHST